MQMTLYKIWIFIKVWNNLDSFKGDSKIYTWIYRIATNESLQFKYLKKKETLFRIHRQCFFTIIKFTYSREILMEMNFQKKFKKLILNEGLSKESAFNMKYFEKMKYDEISEISK